MMAFKMYDPFKYSYFGYSMLNFRVNWPLGVFYRCWNVLHFMSCLYGHGFWKLSKRFKSSHNAIVEQISLEAMMEVKQKYLGFSLRFANRKNRGIYGQYMVTGNHACWCALTCENTTMPDPHFFKMMTQHVINIQRMAWFNHGLEVENKEKERDHWKPNWNQDCLSTLLHKKPQTFFG